MVRSVRPANKGKRKKWVRGEACKRGKGRKKKLAIMDDTGGLSGENGQGDTGRVKSNAARSKPAKGRGHSKTSLETKKKKGGGKDMCGKKKQKQIQGSCRGNA